MSGDLRVTTAHLRELSARQERAAGALITATDVVTGVDSALRWTHGPISWSAASAVEVAQNARRIAGHGIARLSEDLSEKLSAAARRYDHTDGDRADSLKVHTDCFDHLVEQIR
ncbi:ESX-1 secretion-associated protein [Mycobacterium sp. 155]|uniref:ESX-1 secretion-associated protein n=1 Tax=Mycobacterium sp. 155 TaxID=1157943 RepID=UPI00035C92E8|nr:ESX-1 secretion-associated protein [Mycobacterium sp. 155]